MYEIRYVLRLNAQSKKTKEFPVNLEVKIGNQRPRPYTTDVSVLKKYWDNGKVSIEDPLSFSKNEKLSQLQILANEILIRLKLDKKLTYEDFHNIYKSSKKVSSEEQADVVAELIKEEKEKEATKQCLFTLFDKWISDQKVLRGWKESYAKSYRSEVNKWRSYHKFRSEELEKEQNDTSCKNPKEEKTLFVEDITQDTVIDFIGYMRDDLNNDINTIYRTNKRSRQFFEDIAGENLIPDDPYRKVKLKQVIKIPVHLTVKELDILEELKVKFKQDKQYRFLLTILNYFLFACYTGLRYQTLDELSHKEVFDLEYIQVMLDKTNTPTLIPLSDRAKACLPEVINPYSDEKVFNVKSNQYGNRELKVIALMAGIHKRFNHHLARHTFATISLAIGIDLPFVSKLLGHASIRQTIIYTHISDPQRFEQMDKWNKKLDTVKM